MTDQLPPLPQGFTLDGNSAPPLPPGFTLDPAQRAPTPLTPGMAPNPVAHTGYRAQVANAFGNPNPEQLQAKSFGELGQNYGDIAKGAAVGVPAGIVGTPGDVEGLARLIGSKMGLLSPENVLPTSTDVGNYIGGQPNSGYESAGRIAGNLASPYVARLAAKGISKGAGLLLKHVLGLTTGVGPDAIQGAYNAGKEGGTAADAFLAQMRGNAPASDVVQTAKSAVEQLRQEKSAAYAAGIGSSIKGDPAILDFEPIKDAVARSADVGTYKGQSLSDSADIVRDRIKQTVDQWQQLPADRFHTAEGLDALKRKIGDLAYEGDLQTAAKPGSPGAKIIGNVYNAIKAQIVDQAPGYGDVMRDYSNASDELRNIERGLSLNEKATVDTSLRKLQSILRNNANTNYGARVAMGARLNEAGNGTLLPALSGQALSAATPRGLPRLAASGELAAGALHPASIPAMVPLLASSSPRLVGEAAYGLGSLLRPFQQAAGGAANMGAIDPRLIGMMSPQVLARLLLANPQTQSTP